MPFYLCDHICSVGVSNIQLLLYCASARQKGFAHLKDEKEKSTEEDALNIEISELKTKSQALQVDADVENCGGIVLEKAGLAGFCQTVEKTVFFRGKNRSGKSSFRRQK